MRYKYIRIIKSYMDVLISKKKIWLEPLKRQVDHKIKYLQKRPLTFIIINHDIWYLRKFPSLDLLPSLPFLVFFFFFGPTALLHPSKGLKWDGPSESWHVSGRNRDDVNKTKSLQVSSFVWLISFTGNICFTPLW